MLLYLIIKMPLQDALIRYCIDIDIDKYFIKSYHNIDTAIFDILDFNILTLSKI